MSNKADGTMEGPTKAIKAQQRPSKLKRSTIYQKASIRRLNASRFGVIKCDCTMSRRSVRVT